MFERVPSVFYFLLLITGTMMLAIVARDLLKLDQWQTLLLGVGAGLTLYGYKNCDND